jgi:hypothetical protein
MKVELNKAVKNVLIDYCNVSWCALISDEAIILSCERDGKTSVCINNSLFSGNTICGRREDVRSGLFHSGGINCEKGVKGSFYFFVFFIFYFLFIFCCYFYFYIIIFLFL